MIPTLLTIFLGALVLLAWNAAVSWLYARFILTVWWHSYRIDQLVERLSGVPEDERRFP